MLGVKLQVLASVDVRMRADVVISGAGRPDLWSWGIGSPRMVRQASWTWNPNQIDDSVGR